MLVDGEAIGARDMMPFSERADDIYGHASFLLQARPDGEITFSFQRRYTSGAPWAELTRVCVQPFRPARLSQLGRGR